ncbi:NusG domain II-containing protein [Chakrabartyella piscis]|uniref:NusG domain II-containing protein n=1 Tax=Chakrabartyella piscis TaxID=2918914 RepID=UPI002958BC34|nr:NusG domain II-containing protein [Chakrabartyella piscis]
MQKKDKILILVIVIVGAVMALFLQFTKEDGGFAVVTVDGQMVEEYSLETDGTYTIETDAGYNTLIIEDGVVHMLDADCRDHICVEHIAIMRTGETIVCLPHKLVVEVVGGAEATSDLVVG